ncbi:MAG: CBS domain-containing protein [Gammaproteobacteria bacterium]|nr:CBS domain-containing protein [Gammaproteobacteria bacterium]
MKPAIVVRARDVMKTKFDQVDGMATVQEALQTMKHVETKALLVNKRHSDDEYGLLLISDIAREVLAKDKAPERVNVYEVMTKPVISVPVDMDIRYCARLFARCHISRAPVMDGGKVVGMVSLTDLVVRGMMTDE